MCTLSRITVGLFLLLATSPLIGQNLQDASVCSTVLSETGRNLFRQLSITDQRAYFWKQTCSSSDTQADLTFPIAKQVLGLGFSTRDEYCNSERNLWQNYQYNDTRTSTVATEAVSAWLQCVTLFANGLAIAPDLRSSQEQFTFSIRRQGNAVGRINRVVADSVAGTTCFAALQRGNNPNNRRTVEVTSQDPLNYQTPTGEVFVITCRRQQAQAAAPTPAPPGTRRYPQTSITLDTSEGSLTVTLPEEAQPASPWVSDLTSQIQSLRSDFQQTRARLTEFITFPEGDGPVTINRSLRLNGELQAPLGTHRCERIDGNGTNNGDARCGPGGFVQGLWNLRGTDTTVDMLWCCYPTP